MAESAKITDIQSYLDYVQDYRDDLVVRAFYSPKTMQYANVREGVKGRETLTRLKVATGKAVSWKGDFSGAADAVELSPRHLDVAAIKRDLSFIPQAFESSYLGAYRRQGQNAGEDLPYEAYILNSIMAGHAEEVESALWQAVKAGTVTPGTTPMASCFDGILEIIKDEITATNITPVTTSGGAITTTNIVELLESMWLELGAAYKEQQVLVFMSWANFQKYQQGYRADYGVNSNWDPQNGRVYLDFSQNAMLVPMPGMGTSDRVVMTPAGNICVGLDGLNDEMFQMEKVKRQIDFWMDFKLGVQIAQIDEGGLVVNDLE